MPDASPQGTSPKDPMRPIGRALKKSEGAASSDLQEIMPTTLDEPSISDLISEDTMNTSSGDSSFNTSSLQGVKDMNIDLGRVLEVLQKPEVDVRQAALYFCDVVEGAILDVLGTQNLDTIVT